MERVIDKDCIGQYVKVRFLTVKKGCLSCKYRDVREGGKRFCTYDKKMIIAVKPLWCCLDYEVNPKIVKLARKLFPEFVGEEISDL